MFVTIEMSQKMLKQFCNTNPSPGAVLNCQRFFAGCGIGWEPPNTKLVSDSLRANAPWRAEAKGYQGGYQAFNQADRESGLLTGGRRVAGKK